MLHYTHLEGHKKEKRVMRNIRTLRPAGQTKKRIKIKSFQNDVVSLSIPNESQ